MISGGRIIVELLNPPYSLDVIRWSILKFARFAWRDRFAHDVFLIKIYVFSDNYPEVVKLELETSSYYCTVSLTPLLSHLYLSASLQGGTSRKRWCHVWMSAHILTWTWGRKNKGSSHARCQQEALGQGWQEARAKILSEHPHILSGSYTGHHHPLSLPHTMLDASNK
jgi:hypothetical protein